MDFRPSAHNAGPILDTLGAPALVSWVDFSRGLVLLPLPEPIPDPFVAEYITSNSASQFTKHQLYDVVIVLYYIASIKYPLLFGSSHITDF
jgi:hypothetical protein